MKYIKIILALAFFPIVVFCNPTGSEVVEGKATFVEVDKTLNVNQLTDRAIINWQDFFIGPEETTKFVQPKSSSAVLNRVIGKKVSEIYGTLKGNGSIYLVNENGVIVGPEGVIDANNFIASTLDFVDDDFMKYSNDSLSFSGDSDASIINSGTIKALKGDVFLIAQKVENHGNINADNGRVGIAGSNTEVLLTEEGINRISVKGNVGNIENKGVIEATEVELAAVGGNIYSMAINQEGIIKATGLKSEFGRVCLMSEGGEISFSGTTTVVGKEDTGGIVDVDANKIHMKEGSLIDVSNDSLGGSVFLKSKGSDNSVKIDAGANIKTDSTGSGRYGGLVNILGDDICIDGSIRAKAHVKGFWNYLDYFFVNYSFGGDIQILCDKNLSITGNVDISGYEYDGNIFIIGKDMSLIKRDELNETVKNPVILPETKGTNIIVTDMHKGITVLQSGKIHDD